MMMDALNKKGYSAFSLSVPSPSELLMIFGLAAPVFITMMSKVDRHSVATRICLLSYLNTSVFYFLPFRFCSIRSLSTLLHQWVQAS